MLQGLYGQSFTLKIYFYSLWAFLCCFSLTYLCDYFFNVSKLFLKLQSENQNERAHIQEISIREDT